MLIDLKYLYLKIMISFINEHAFPADMPAPRLRSRSLRKVFRKVSGGVVSLQYKKKKPKSAKCGNCGAVLKGIPRALPFRMRSMAKTKKRPERPFGGVLCSKCMREGIIDKARQYYNTSQ